MNELSIRRSDLKVDFVNFEEDFGESHSYPMGILYISAYLKKQGFTNVSYVDHICLLRKIEETKASPSRRVFLETWKSINERREKNLKELFGYLKERQPHIILLGPITTLHLVELKDLVERLRQQFPKPLILAGGPHFGKDPSLDQELLKLCPGLDGVVIGEAEDPILFIVDRFHYKWWKEKTLPSRVELLNENVETSTIVIRDKTLMSKKPIRLENLSPPDMSLLEEYWNNPKTHIDYRYSLSKRRNPFTRTFRAVVDDYSGDDD
jgi:hypothetical protein